jgi:hypothetical protein
VATKVHSMHLHSCFLATMENPMALNALVLWLQTSSTSSLSACIWLEVMGRQLTFGYTTLIVTIYFTKD